MQRQPTAAATKPVWIIVAHDGDDEDGGTSDMLVDDQGVPRAVAPWPQMLEALAAQCGARTARRGDVLSRREWS